MKMVIAMRTDLNMRKGKMVAQGGHAACMPFIVYSLKEQDLAEWVETGMKKICVGVDSEEGLVLLVDKAKDKGVPFFPVYDSGLTEFNGKTTLTCAAFGPAIDDDIDEITGELKLL